MSWFGRYMGKWSHNDFDDDYIRSQLPEPKWMEQLPNGQFYWQVSLDKAMQRGKQELGVDWNGSQYGVGMPGEESDNKKGVFYDWLERVPPVIVSELKDMVDDYLEKTEGFRPFDTPRRDDLEQGDAEDIANVEPWSSEELSDWMS